MVRPYNYIEEKPGVGYVTVNYNGIKITVMQMLGQVFMAEEATHDVYAGIDLIIDKIQGQLRKQKTKMLKTRTENTIQMGVTEEDLDIED